MSLPTDTSNEISPEALGFKRELRLHKGIIFLPPSLDIVPQLLRFLGDEEKDGEMLAELIRLDPGLTTDVLRVANSAAFAGSVRMDSLNSAVLRLGLREVYRIVLEVVASPVFLNATQPGAASLDLWKHSLRSGIAAQVLSRHLGEDAELAFTAALLHDVGKLVFHQLFEDSYVAFVHQARRENATLHQRETAQFSTDHASVGGRLLKRWNFPETIVHSVQFHHDPNRCPKPDLHLVSLVCAANLLAYKIAEGVPPYLQAAAAQILKNLGLQKLDDLWSYENEVRETFERESARMTT
jgi:putative nucleotidyltransferase with HDIG domain